MSDWIDIKEKLPPKCEVVEIKITNKIIYHSPLKAEERNSLPPMEWGKYTTNTIRAIFSSSYDEETLESGCFVSDSKYTNDYDTICEFDFGEDKHLWEYRYDLAYYIRFEDVSHWRCIER